MAKISLYSGETVICSIEVRKKSDRTLVDPSSAKIKIELGTVVKITDDEMTKDLLGKYHYDWVSDEVGTYIVTYTVTLENRITKQKDTFTVQ
jgi:hypothetical protein